LDGAKSETDDSEQYLIDFPSRGMRADRLQEHCPKIGIAKVFLDFLCACQSDVVWLQFNDQIKFHEFYLGRMFISISKETQQASFEQLSRLRKKWL
jgi:hypothetical protein